MKTLSRIEIRARQPSQVVADVVARLLVDRAMVETQDDEEEEERRVDA